MMPAPTLEQTRGAALAITALPPADFKRRQTAEAGDVLVAMLAILARKLFATDSEQLNARRVELMLASYFLRGSLERRAVKPPDEARARDTVNAVASLGQTQLDARITAEVGDAVLAFFETFAQQFLPDADEQRRAKNVQLMVLAYLLRGDLPSAGPS